MWYCHYSIKTPRIITIIIRKFEDLYPLQKRTNGDLTSRLLKWAVRDPQHTWSLRCKGKHELVGRWRTETQVTWSGTGARLLQASASLPGHYFWSPFLFWSPITIRWEHSARLLPILFIRMRDKNHVSYPPQYVSPAPSTAAATK